MRTRSPLRLRSGVVLPAVVTVLMLAILTIPLVSFRYLPLQDLPNHQARLWLESSLAGMPDLARYFRIAWQPAPSLALDLTIPFVAAVTGTAVAMRAFLLAILGLLAIGVFLVNRAMAERAQVAPSHWPLWPLTGLLFFYNKILTLGFLSFLGTAAAGLIVVALGLRWRGRREPWRIAILAICAFALLIGHGHAFACVGLALVAAEFGAQRRAGSSFAETVTGVAIAALPFVIAAGVFVMLPGRFSPGLRMEYRLRLKAYAFGSLVQLYDSWAEALVELAAAAAFAFACWRKWIVVPSETRWMAGVLFATFLLLPFTLGGSDYADFRLPVFIVWLLIAGSIVPAGVRRPLLPGAVLLGLTAIQTGYVATRWSAFQPAYAAVDAALDRIAPGARVVTVSNYLAPLDRWNTPPLLQAPLRAVWRRHALVSGLFLNGGLPVRLQPAYAHLGTQSDWFRPIHVEDDPATREAFFDRQQLAGYDYLVLLRPAPVRYLVPGRFPLITQSRWLALYDLRQPAR